PPFSGVCADEFREYLIAAVGLPPGVPLLSYAGKFDLARGYVVVALPCTAAFDVFARYQLRKWLHRQRRSGQLMRRTVAVGHAAPVEDLVGPLRRHSHHGLSVVAARVAGAQHQGEGGDTPICGDLDSVACVVSRLKADPGPALA